MGKTKLEPLTTKEDEALTAAAKTDPDNPPLTEEDFAEMKPAEDVPELAALLRTHGKLGRPPLPDDEKKRRVTMYLDADVLARLKEGGKGWQTRANAALRAALGL